MPLITIVGCPGSGKSEVARRIQEITGVDSCVIVAHKGLQDYKDAETEKISRGELFSAVERLLSSQSTVVCDACNYIGGFRYQLFCSAKAMQTSTAVVWCQGGDEESPIGQRFEPPKEKNRWDRPLIVARRNPETKKMEFDESRLAEAMRGRVLKGPNLSTLTEPRSQALNVDHELTLSIAEIIGLQKEGNKTALPRSVTMGELRLWKRDYLQLSDLADIGKSQNVQKSFLSFCAVKCCE